MTALIPTTLCALDRANEAYLFHCWFKHPLQQDVEAQHNTTAVFTYFVVAVVLQVFAFHFPHCTFLYFQHVASVKKNYALTGRENSRESSSASACSSEEKNMV